MPEPTSTAAAATGLFILTSVDPTAYYSLIVFGALVGSMHSLAASKVSGNWAAARYIAKWILTAVLLTGAVTAIVDQYTTISIHRWPGAVAFGITFLANYWPQLIPEWVRVKNGLPQGKQDESKP